MAFENPLLARWRAGDATFGLWCSTSNAALGEYAARTDVDWILWDQQHGLVSDTDLAGLFRTCLGTDVVPLARVAANDVTLIGRALDTGAYGVVVPLVNTAEEAARAVAACRFPPHGSRSFGPNRVTLAFGDLSPAIIQDVACIVMIETSQGLENAEAIAATPGVDGVLIGPSDLALGLGLEFHDRGKAHAKAVKTILDACRAAGIAAGIVLTEGTTAKAHADLGFQFISTATDIGLIVDGLTAELKTARGSAR